MDIYGAPVYRFGDMRITNRNNREQFEFPAWISRDFALKTLDFEMTNFIEARLQKEASIAIHALGYCEANPLSFYENSLLVSGFKIGDNGTWLNADLGKVKRLKSSDENCLVYHSHNASNNSNRAALTTIFMYWTDSAEVVLDMRK